MNETAITEKRLHATGCNPSMKRRSDINNYHGRHVYMVTLAVEGRRALLGELRGDASLPPGHRDAPHVFLSPLGQEVARCWSEIPRRHPEIQVLAFQMMPDHLHGILFVKEEMEMHLGQVISGFKAGCNKAYRRLIIRAEEERAEEKRAEEKRAEAMPLPTHREEEDRAATPKAGTSLERTDTGANLERTKAGANLERTKAGANLERTKTGVNLERTKTGASLEPYPSSLLVQGAASPCQSAQQQNTQQQSTQQQSTQRQPTLSPLPSEHRLKPDDRKHGLLFERGYNDLISKDYDMLPRLIAYVHDNPRRLLLKRQRPEWLRPFFGLQLGGDTYSGIGNLNLLLAESRKAVRVSRHVKAEEADYEEATYLAAARAGTVLISPAISPGEKRVMRAAFNAQMPTVVIVPNGFTPFSKPHGEQFEACAGGRLLMLSPWPHSNQHRPLTRLQCHAMNMMALHLSTVSPEEVQESIRALSHPNHQQQFEKAKPISLNHYDKTRAF